MNKFLFTFPLLSLMTLMNACGAPQAASQTAAPVENFGLKFSAAVKGQPFRCGQDYTGIGTSGSTIRSKDFRFYINHPRLVAADGSEIPITLSNDGKWQYKNLALLDFEDATGGCEGNADMNSQISGTVPAGKVKPGMSLRFELGVPFELNHADASRAPSPLNLTSLFWAWRFGYKFARLDFSSKGQPQGYFIHLGSTGCSGDMAIQHEIAPSPAPSADAHGMGMDGSFTRPPAACSAPNRPTITLSGFDATQQHVEADLGRLLSESDVDVNQPDTPGGCMSGDDDSDCRGIFKHLGLGPDASQSFFSLKAN